jgi:hypothetical protein
MPPYSTRLDIFSIITDARFIANATIVANSDCYRRPWSSSIMRLSKNLKFTIIFKDAGGFLSL